ncbi:MAG: M4 family metallopeptidase [Actinomycetota bacterium]
MSATRRCLFGIILCSLLTAGLGFVPGAAVAGAGRDGISRLQADGRGIVMYTGASGRVSFVTGSVPIARFSDKKKAADVARDFFRAYGSVFGVTDASNQLTYRGTRSDRQGWSHVSFDQNYEDLGVFGRRLSVHIHDEAVTAVNGDFVPGINVPTTPTISSSKANANARSHLASRGPKKSKKAPDLLVYVTAGGAPHLAWHVTTPTARPFGFWKTFVDARTGAVLASYDDLHAAKTLNVFDGGSNGVCDTGAIAPDCTLPDPSSDTPARADGAGPVADAEVNAAYDNTSSAYDYFSATFGRDSYDDADHPIVSTVHFGSNDFNNAFWCPEECAQDYGIAAGGEQLVFGNFDGVSVNSLAADQDIVTHELTHALTSSTADLFPLGQSGALGESYSDVFAALRADDWIVGEDAFGAQARDLTQAASMSNFVQTAYDGGGVHANSLIPSHAAYLLRSNILVGKAKTEQIMYRALTQYLYPFADFEYNMLSVYVAALDLYGVDFPAIPEAVVTTFDEVGIVARAGVIAPGAADLIQGGSPTTVSWTTPGTEGHTFAVEYGVPSGSPTSNQGFESTSLPAGFVGGGSAGWLTTTELASSGSRSVRSGVIGADQNSTLSVTRTFAGAGSVEFQVAWSTDPIGDPWSFYVDDQLYDAQAGISDWDHFYYAIPPGTHTFTWVYERDDSAPDDETDNTVAIDDLSFTNSPTYTWTTINGATSPNAREQAWTTPLVSNGAYRARVLTSGHGNGLGEALSAPFTVDATPPAASVTSGLALWQLVASRSSGGTTTFTVPWSGSDPLSGIANYDLRWRYGSLAGTYTPYSDIYFYTTQTSFRTTYTGTEGKTLCFGVRAQDGVGNLSNYSGDRCTAVPIDDRELSRTSGWSLRTGSAYYMGTYAQTTTQGAYLISGSYRAKRISLIATKCSTCGTIEVYRGSTRLARISLRSSTTRYRQLINIKTYSSVTSAARYKIRVYTAGKLVRIEGLGLSLY